MGEERKESPERRAGALCAAELEGGRQPKDGPAARRRDQGGRLQARTYVLDGLDSAPRALQDLFTGANLGKTLVRV